MPAKARCRIDEAGLYYHIYNRGVEGRVIFNGEDDYNVFIGFLEDYLSPPKDPDSVKKVFKINGRSFRGTPHQPKNYFNDLELIAYSLNPNHFHLILHQKTLGSQEKFLRSLCTRYSMYFNKRYQRSGSLFEGPYRSIPIKGNKNFLPYLTRFLHHTEGYSSYPEYLGKRSTPWVKSQVILSLCKMNAGGYKYFMEEHKYDQKEKEFIGGIIFNNDTECLERRSLSSSEETRSDTASKTRTRLPEFLAGSFLVFSLLTGLGIRNIINVAISKTSQSAPVPQVLPAQTEEATSGAILEEIPETTSGSAVATVKLDDPSLTVNIRERPATDSAKLGKAQDGETFEFVSKDAGWYEVKLANGSTGFISGEFIVEEANN